MAIQRSLRRRLGWLCFLGLAAAGVITSSARPVAQTPQVTFAKDIAPILQRSCQNCHNAEGGGPMSLVTYEEVRPWAKAIKLRTASREMPPYFLEPYVGIQKFKDDPRLSDREIAKIAGWADSGALYGNPADMPPGRKFPTTKDWSIGTPDLIISSPEFTVEPLQPDWHIDLPPVPNGLTETRYIKAIEVKEIWLSTEGFRYSRSVVHHAGLHTGPIEVMEKGQLPTQGLGGGRLRYTYEVGQNAQIYPDDAGVMLEAGDAILFNLHAHANGTKTRVRVDAGFKLHPKGFKPKYLMGGFETLGSLNDEIEIPPNQDNVQLDSFHRLSQPAIFTTFEPHMHQSGKRMCVEAIYPDGRRETLNCSGYNHNWVKVYTYEDDAAPLLPRDTVLHIIGWHNNSPSNRLIVDPRNWRTWGNRSIDEMFLFMPKVKWLTDEQFKEEVAAREARSRQKVTTGTAAQQ